MQLTPIDFILIAVILVSMIRVALKGFVEEFSSMAAFIVGILAAVLLYKPATVWLVSLKVVPVLSVALAFLGVFIIAYLAVKIGVGAFGSLLDSLNLDSLDHALGILLGAVEGILLVCVILIVIRMQPFFPIDRLLQKSLVAHIFLPIIDTNLVRSIRVPGKA